jgi:uncharacterized protein (DUF1778 family)
MFERRTERVNLSLTPSERRLIELAAGRSDQLPTTFAQQAAVDVARRLVVDSDAEERP